MIAGLSFQVAFLALFMILCAEFGFRVRSRPEFKNPQFSAVRSTFKFKAFLWSKYLVKDNLALP
jgi:RTA1 like protein